MMRQIQVCLPLVLSGLLGSAVLAGQQASSAPTQKPAQTTPQTSTEQTHRSATTHHAVHKRQARTSRKGKKRPAYRPEYSENSVEVINGDATRKVVFHDEQNATVAGKKLPAGMKNVPAPMKVEVVNGASTNTQYFYDAGQNSQVETARSQPVVIGIQSSDTRTLGGNRQPVVTSVTSSGVQSGKSVGRGGQPVTKQVSPRPKRPPYQPEPH